MPYINMINTTAFANESEILLPRNIKFKLKRITEKEKVIPGHKYPPPDEHMSIPEERYKFNIYDIDVSMINKDQFKMDTCCNNYGIVTLSLKDDYKYSSTKSGEINKELDPIVHKIKLPRCPNGQRRNKKSGKCTKNLTKKTVTKKTVTKPVKDLKTKKKRCPNGSRRNKKTGNCESTK